MSMIKFTQITTNRNDREADLFALDNYGRIWRWVEALNTWKMLNNPTENN